MKDITGKPETLRVARATAAIRMPSHCVELLRLRKTDKGDALEVARTAGIMAAKRTWELLPFCHPLPLQFVGIEYGLEAERVVIQTELRVVAATGVEMEALTAASVTALTLYDMLKPHAGRDLEITDVRLLDKRGGKSDFARRVEPAARCAILVVSDAVAGGRKPDEAGRLLQQGLAEAGIEVTGYEILSDETQPLQDRLQHWTRQNVNLVVTVGGTGIAKRDRSVEAVRPLLEREMPGIMEAARDYGQRRTPYAMISRGIAGLVGNTLVVTFPGSTRGARETLQALLPGLVHAIEVLRHSES